MEICGKCGREPWDGICPLLPEIDAVAVVEPQDNAYTKANCGHPCIGISPLIIKPTKANE